MVLAKGPSADNLFECAKHFLDTDPDLGDIVVNMYMFTTDTCSRQRVGPKLSQNHGDIGKHACLTDGLVRTQLLKFCQNTRTQFISANINIPDSDNVIAQHKHVDWKIAYEILQKGTRGSFRNWSQCSNIRQGGHGSSLPWLCWLSIVCGTTVMVPKPKCARP